MEAEPTTELLCRLLSPPEPTPHTCSGAATHHGLCSLLPPITGAVVKGQEPQQGRGGFGCRPQELLGHHLSPSSEVNEQVPALQGTSAGPGTQPEHKAAGNLNSSFRFLKQLERLPTVGLNCTYPLKCNLQGIQFRLSLSKRHFASSQDIERASQDPCEA